MTIDQMGFMVLFDIKFFFFYLLIWTNLKSKVHASDYKNLSWQQEMDRRKIELNYDINV